MTTITNIISVKAAQLREAEDAARDAEYRFFYGKTSRERDEASSDKAFYDGRVASLRHEIGRLKEQLASPRVGDDPKNHAALTSVGATK